MPLAFLLAVTMQVNPVVFCTVALDVSLDVQYNFKSSALLGVIAAVTVLVPPAVIVRLPESVRLNPVTSL